VLRSRRSSLAKPTAIFESSGSGRREPRRDGNEYVRSAQHLSGAELSLEVAERFGVVLHRRTLERLRST
jgi:hypothetical protein